jgi:hypothetical protein
LRREGDDLIAPRFEERVGRHQHRHDALPRQSREGGVELGVGAGIQDNDRPTDRARRF